MGLRHSIRPPVANCMRHRAMVASPWWEGCNSQGSQLQNACRLSLNSLVSKASQDIVRWSKVCLGMRLQAKSGSKVGCYILLWSNVFGDIHANG